jgi:hypothetical protein
MNERRNIHHPRRRLRLVVTLLLAASLLAQAVLGWPASAPRTIHAQRSAAAVAPQPILTLQPSNGPVGTTTSTATISPTATANTPTVTATGTNTPAVVPGTSTATASNTATQTPVTPTATAAPMSPSPMPTATKGVRPQAIVLIKPAFSVGAVAVVVHTGAYGHVSIDFQVVAPNAQGHQQQRYDLKKGGTADSLGVFTIRMGIAYHKPGTAVITITLSDGGSTRIVRRSYRYGVTGG